MSHDVFICHSSLDRTIANAVCATLEQNRIRCWIAPRDVVPGREWAVSIIEAIHGSRLAVLVFSAHSNDSQHVHKEIKRAVHAGIPVLPFRVEDVVPSPALEYFISDAHWLDALTPPLESHLDYLVGTVQLLLQRQAAAHDETTPSDGDSEVARLPTTETPSPSPAAPRARRTFLWAGLAAALVALAVVVGLSVVRGGSGATDKAGTAATTTFSQTPSKPFTEEFTKAVDPSWTWLNENKAAWRVSDKGWLEIDAQQAPPYRNVLLRAVPKGSYSIRVDLKFPAGASGFAGLVVTGADPDSRLQFGWTKTALSATEYKDGSIVTDSQMLTSDLPVSTSRDAQLLFEVKDGMYVTKYYNPEIDSYFDMGTTRLDPTYTKVGLMVYSTSGATVTASFDRFEIFF